MDALQYDLKTIALGNGEGSYLTRQQRHRGLQLLARELRALGYKLPGARSLKPRHVGPWSSTGVQVDWVPAR